MIEKIRLMLLAAELVVLSVQDIRRRKLSFILLLLLLAASVVLIGVEAIVWKRNISEEYFVLGLVFGGCLIILSYLFRLLGLGDGMTVLLIALMTNGVIVIQSFLIAIMMAALTGSLLLLVGRVHRKYEMAFVPYLLFSTIGVVIWI